MHRTFRTSTSRRQTYLDGFWDFITDPDDVGVDQEWYAAFPKGGRQVYVPGVWNMMPGNLHYEGPAWYRKRFEIGSCQALRVQFAAVTHLANVWLDGELLGEHYGGFLPFGFVLPAPEPGRHELVVRVDNTHDMVGSLPSANLDWARYGGIPRPVWLEELASSVLIASCRLVPDVISGQCQIVASLELQNLCDTPLQETLTILVGGDEVFAEPVALAPNDTVQRVLKLKLGSRALWSPESPALYYVELRFGGDNLFERVGFRHLEINGSQVLMNGAPLRIRGVNRHDDHPDWGFAIPEPITLRDLDLLRDLGMNALRTAHYPSDERMLDLCDERGILVIEEIPLSGFSASQLAIDMIADRACAMLWGMIQRDAGHPAIWAWSLLNECGTDTMEGYAVVERLSATARDLDPSRPITYASKDALNDICFSLVDLVTVNAFFGWYSFDFTWPAYLERVRRRIGGKPLLVGEFGAEGLYGFRSLEENVMWSEEYQRKVVCESAAQLLEQDDLVGFYVWQFCDSRSDSGIHALNRPRTFNNKGLLDEYRRPKLVFYALRDLLNRVCPQQFPLL